MYPKPQAQNPKLPQLTPAPQFAFDKEFSFKSYHGTLQFEEKSLFQGIKHSQCPF